MDVSADIDIVARTIYGEARGEGKDGMTAVACVIVNRAIIAGEYMDAHGIPHPLFGDGDLASACKERLQFDCWDCNDPNLKVITGVALSDPVFAVATAIARLAENDQLDDITGNATHYYDRRMPYPPSWSRGKTPCFKLRNHLFFNNIA